MNPPFMCIICPCTYMPSDATRASALLKSGNPGPLAEQPVLCQATSNPLIFNFSTFISGLVNKFLFQRPKISKIMACAGGQLVLSPTCPTQVIVTHRDMIQYARQSPTSNSIFSATSSRGLNKLYF